MTPAPPGLLACHCCGLVQAVPAAATGRPGLRCGRCHTRLRGRRRGASHRRTGALALAALVLFPVAVGLPIMQVESFGSVRSASIWTGTWQLLAEGQWFVGSVVLLCSIVLPLTKLLGLFVLAGGGLGLAPRMRARTWHLVEFTGRWGMLDVLLVAILVAVLKLGDQMDLHAGPGATAFTACVLLNLLASASFDPHAHWEPST